MKEKSEVKEVQFEDDSKCESEDKGETEQQHKRTSYAQQPSRKVKVDEDLDTNRTQHNEDKNVNNDVDNDNLLCTISTATTLFQQP